MAIARLPMLEGLRARWERLSERERLLAGAGAIAAFLLLLAIVVLFVSSALGDLRDDNDAIRQALKDIDAHRESYLKARSKTANLESRIGRGEVQLEGLLEGAAGQADIQIDETNEEPPQAVKNSKYIERDVDLRIRKCTLPKLAKFLRAIETGPNLIVVTGLHTRVRDDRHEDLEVEVKVTTWQRAPDKGGARKGNDAKEAKGS